MVLQFLVGRGKDFHGSVDFENFGWTWKRFSWIRAFWRISKILWILVGSGKDFHGLAEFNRFLTILLDLGRISMDPWMLQHFGNFGWT